MKTITNILVLVLSLTLISGCMPASFTKWKQNAPTTKTPTSVFTDDSGNPIPSGSLKFPTYINYHPTGVSNPQPISIAATSSTILTAPEIDGDLSDGYPFSAQGQSLAPSFSVESLPVPYNCGGNLLLYPGSASDLTINSASGVVSVAAGVYASPGLKEYCIKLTYKTPISTKPGYTYAYLYGILNIHALRPLSTLDFKQSTHLILTLSDYIDLNQFTQNNTITASPSTARATIEYFDRVNKNLYVTATVTTDSVGFRVNDTIRVASGGVGAPYYDARLGAVTNLYSLASSLLTPNIITYPLTSSSALADNGVIFALSPSLPANPPFSIFDTLTGTYTVISSDRDQKTPTFIAQNGLGTVQIPFSYRTAKGIYPPGRSGDLRFPHSATVTLNLGAVSGNVNDFSTSAVVTSSGASGVILSSNFDTQTGVRSVTISVTATGTEGFYPGHVLLAGSSQAKIEKATNVFVVDSTNNIVDHNGNPFVPYWTNGNQTGNGIEYTFTTTTGDDSFITTATSTGGLTGFSPTAQDVAMTIKAFNDFGETSVPLYLSFQLKGTATLGLAYVQKKVASCNARVKLILSNIQGGDNSAIYTLFPKSKPIWANNSSEATSATVTYLNDKASEGPYLVANVQQGYFFEGQSIDSNTSTYTVSRATIKKVINIFEKDVALCAGQMTPIVTPTGEPVTYAMTPDLPSTALGLSFDTSTGAFTGNPTADTTEGDYVIKATGATGSALAKFSFQVATSPRALSYTRQVFMRVNQVDEFFPGSGISSPVATNVTPIETKASGIVRKRIGTTGEGYLLVDVINGSFDSFALLDKYQTFKDPRAEVIEIQNSSFYATYTGGALPSVTATVPQYIFTNSASAVGYLVYTDASTMVVRAIKGAFKVGDTFCVNSVASLTACPGGTTPYTIQSISTSNYSLTLNNPNSFQVGKTIIAATGAVNTANGKTFVVTATPSASSIDVTSQSYNSSLAVNDTIYDYLNYTGSSNTVTGIAHNPTFYMYQGEKISILPDLMEGSDIVYALTGSLPPGLEFNTTTGLVSGTVLNSTTGTGTSIKVTASNFMGEITYDLKIRAFRHFEVKTAMTEAPGMLTHKEGLANQVAPCRVTWEQSNDTTNVTDRNIVCYVDAGEMDLYKEGLELGVFAGKNMCEKVVYTPYFFWSFTTGYTDDRAYYYINNCTNPTTVPAAGPIATTVVGYDTVAAAGLQDTIPGVMPLRAGAGIYDYNGTYSIDYPRLCRYSHLLSNGQTKNCDAGRLNIRSRVFIDDPSVGYCSGAKDQAVFCTNESDCESMEVSCTGASATGTAGTWIPSCVEDSDLWDDTKKYDCGGSYWNCAEGGVRDILSEDSFNAGMRSIITSTVNGLDKKYTVAAPISRAHHTNLNVANYTRASSCAPNATPYRFFADSWQKYANYWQTYQDPFGRAQPFYTLSCLDAAGDTKAKIRLLVRDWNRDFLNSMIYSLGLDTVIPETATYDYMDIRTDDPYMGGSYNERADWDDDYSDYNGNFDYNEEINTGASLGACSSSASPTVTRNFPYPGEAL